MTLTDFLLARIAEDETDLRGVGAHKPRRGGPAILNNPADPMHANLTRGLRECEAKRRIVALYDSERRRVLAYRSPRAREVEDEQARQGRLTQEARHRVAEDVARLLALPYADHPDYREEWKP